MSRPHHVPEPPHEYRRMVAVRKIGEAGLVQTVDASAAELAKIAAFLDIVDLKRVSCEFRLTRWRARGIKLSGVLQATVIQACVVTLEPVEESLSATFERRFLPADMLEDEDDPDDVFVDPEGEDPPEPMGSEIDLGEVVVEELALNLNPYPRVAGSALPEGGTHPEDQAQQQKEKPFAALARLKLKTKNEP